MKRNPITIAAVAMLAAGMAFAQTAATPASPIQSGLKLRAAVRQRILKNLNLTAAQKAQAKDIMQQTKTAAQPLRAQLQANRQSLAAAVKSNDTAQIQSLAAAQGALQGQILAIQSAGEAKFYAILTPDQQTALGQMQEKLKQLRQQLKAL
jgi:Spy/CpxP family protein refolding chaperone